MYLFATVITIIASCSLQVGRAQILRLAIDESCDTDEKGRVWSCQLLSDCPQLDVKKVRPKICSFQRLTTPVICCPPAPSTIAMDKCVEYLFSACREHSVLVKRQALFTHVVVGGRKSKPRTHRHMALIGFGPANAKSWRCGGSLISERYVLSAAHCSGTYDAGFARWVRLGELDYSTNEDDANPVDIEIVERINHPKYKPPAAYHDIALFKLATNVVFNRWIKPACLYTSANIPSGTEFIATGWGRVDYVGRLSSALMEVELPLVPGDTCKRLMDNAGSRKIPDGFELDSMMCAGNLTGGKDTCTGDSGGPLIFGTRNPEECLKMAVGVTSFGRQCALPNSPGVYMKIPYYIPWIEKIVWP